MAKYSFTLFACIVLCVPAVILGRPQINQDRPQVQPPVFGRPSVLPANPETSQDVVAPDAPPAIGNHVQPQPEGAIGNHVQPQPGGPIGNHVEPGVVIEDAAENKDNVSTSEATVGPQVGSVSGCPRFYKPVCGSDKVTYNTECELKIAQTSNSALTKSADGPC